MKLILDRIKNGIETIKDPLGENVYSYGRIEVDSETCNLCGLCEKECPVNAISIMDGKLEMDSRKCIFCKLCIDVCPNDSLEMTHDYKISAIEELREKIRREVYSTFQRSLTLRAVDVGSCNGCFLELSAIGNTYYDMSRYGIHIAASPRHADGLIVSGALSINMKEALIKAYEAIPNPKIVIALGACSYDGGIYKDGYSVIQRVDEVIPVDIHIPGCPPSPAAILEGVLKIMKNK
ncbi:MAG: NADH-quinone oxidoreductase subunit NuoB [Peptostreptococcaceae bacterium]|nr:NADH-quinone oxidoreductase subunit NuoB [Peptostreptococcaceae bacterium]